MTTPTILESKKKEFIQFLKDNLMAFDDRPEDYGIDNEDIETVFNWIITNFQPKDEK